MRRKTDKRFSSGKISAKKIVLFTVAAVIILPVVYAAIMIGAFVHGCDVKMADIANQATDTTTKLSHLSVPALHIKAQANGDCLTASGTGFEFSTNKAYASPTEAKNDIITNMAAVGMTVPTLAQVPDDISVGDGGASGGNTPIKQIHLSYRLSGYNDLEFTFSLDQAVPCVVVSEQQAFCGGEDKDAHVQHLLATQPISSTLVMGTIRHP